MICKGCGLEINERAPTCFKCGTIQAAGAAPPRPRMEDDVALRMVLPVGRSVLSIAAGYLGLFAVLGVFAPIALIVSIAAIVQLKRNPEKRGMGRAIFGLVMGVVFTGLYGIMLGGALLRR